MKNRLTLAVVVIVAIVAALVFIKPSEDDNMANMSMAGNQNSSETMSEPNTVTMKNIEFTVKKLTIKKGTTVTWRNDDSAQHDVIFDDSEMSKANSDGLLSKGEKHEYTFTETGTFPYHCTPHPFMKAEIEVVEA